MTLNKLFLPRGYDQGHGWNQTLCRMLAQSGMFQVEVKDFPVVRVPGVRNQNWNMMEVDGALIGLDTWDTYDPLSTYLRQGLFDPGEALGDIDLLLKIQYYECHIWKRLTERTGIPVHPWTVMPTRVFPLGAFQWKSEQHQYIATVTGKNNRFGRQPWVDWCVTQPDFVSKSNYVGRDSLDHYIDILKNCQWGLILGGKTRRHDRKNRRECEFTSCGMPLAMNYQPTYDFPMKAGEQFFLLTKPEDLSNLRDVDPRPFAEASRQLFRDHFSPKGIAQGLITMTQELKRTNSHHTHDLPETFPRFPKSPTNDELQWLHDWLHANCEQGCQVLEFGCGPTTWSISSAVCPSGYVAVERWEPAIRETELRLPEVEIIQSTWNDIPKKKYDVVFVDSSAGYPGGSEGLHREKAVIHAESMMAPNALVILHDWHARYGRKPRLYLEQQGYRLVASQTGRFGIGVYQR